MDGGIELDVYVMTRAWYGVVPTEAMSFEQCNSNSKMVVSILAELYNPCGFWEPWKLQLKLMSQSLAGIEWDEYIRAKDQDSWNYLD